MKYTQAININMKSHPDYNEKWLQERIIEDPSILGLGDVVVRDVERRQHRAGRLDLLLQDSEEALRYEVELQLGASDESHIIRTLEYWDLENRRYPQFDHVAVLVAEDITSRFLNVVSLFNGFIPLIAIQIKAIQIGEYVTLSATRILDRSMPGDEIEDTSEKAITDRDYWLNRATPATVAVADQFLELVREVTGDNKLQLKYNKYYMGMARDGVADNFVYFKPKKSHCQIGFRIAKDETLAAEIEEAGLEVLQYDRTFRRMRIRVSAAEIQTHRDVLARIILRAKNTTSSDSSEE